ncbi:MAG: hypothetical protein Q7U47_01865 [Paludibacter sp.]|nr:hypothetical protein [Paludibacter sp.]
MTTSNTNKILVFFVLTFLFSLLITEIQHFYKLFEHLNLALLAPGVVGILLILYYEEPGSNRFFWERRILPSVKPTFIQIIIALLPIIIIPLSFYLYKTLYNPYIETSKIELSYLLWPIIGIFFEELGWRGYLQHRSGTFIHLFIATMLTGFFWFFVQYEIYLSDPFYGVITLIIYLSFSFILAYLFYTSNRNIILGYIFRLSHTIIALIFISEVINDISFMFIMAPLYLIAAIIIVVLNKKLFQIDTKGDL